jgi:hypothetical protein
LFKKIAAILLLSILLFNWVGYRLLTAYWQRLAARELQARLDKNAYDPTSLILLRVSADLLPYSNSSDQFEKAEGTIEIGHCRYQYVKKRLYNDSLEFLCIPDGAANRLSTLKNNFFGLVNDLQKTGHGKIPGSSGKVAGDSNKICCLKDLSMSLHYFPSALIPPGLLQPAVLPTGHPRIGQEPPRPLA